MLSLFRQSWCNKGWSLYWLLNCSGIWFHVKLTLVWNDPTVQLNTWHHKLWGEDYTMGMLMGKDMNIWRRQGWKVWMNRYLGIVNMKVGTQKWVFVYLLSDCLFCFLLSFCVSAWFFGYWDGSTVHVNVFYLLLSISTIGRHTCRYLGWWTKEGTLPLDTFIFPDNYPVDTVVWYVIFIFNIIAF